MSRMVIPAASTPNVSSFRNVSACNRCRQRKNRCDQQLPRCLSCEKADVRCVGYDPITKKEIPRSYLYFLETRVEYLERLLVDNGIEFKAAEAFDWTKTCGKDVVAADNDAKALTGIKDHKTEGKQDAPGKLPQMKKEDGDHAHSPDQPESRSLDGHALDTDREHKDDERLDRLVSDIGMVSVQGASDPRYLGSTSGISFAKLVFAAVKSSVGGHGSGLDRSTTKPRERLPSAAAGSGESTMRDSFFGLQARTWMECATFPSRSLGERLMELYFEHANPQMPILHRGDFTELFNRVYSTPQDGRSPRDLYFVNIVFAIGAGIIFGGKASARDDHCSGSLYARPSKRQKISNHQYQPEEYHASAVIHLEAVLGSSSSGSGSGGGLEELQVVLLLASFALLRPVTPGLWYIVGVAVRLAIDLGLHYEDGTGIDSFGEGNVVQLPPSLREQSKVKIHPDELGRREWVRDFRRRLWWCVYSFDRLVGTCVGRPFGISDQVITTDFPSLLDDGYITKAGFLAVEKDIPSYKHVAHHYFKLRLLQSEIQQVLQYQQARHARRMRKNDGNSSMHTKLPCPFLQPFETFRLWRDDVHRRLTEWKDSAPSHQDIGVQFSLQFLELNYWQALIMLYGPSLAVPAPLAEELSPTENVSSPSFSHLDSEDEDDIYLKVAEAGQKVLRIYRQLHLLRLVNYTYLATHHLFMAGVSFLYAIWHSPVVRSHLTMEEVDFAVLAATSILGDLMEKCPPAEACRDAFERMSRETIQMCISTTGFGPKPDVAGTHPDPPGQSSVLGSYLVPRPQRSNQVKFRPRSENAPPPQVHPRYFGPMPQSSMSFDHLFKDGTLENRNLSPTSGVRQRLQPSEQPRYTGQPVPNFPHEQPPEQYQNTRYLQSDNGSSQAPYYYPSSPQSVSSNGAPPSYGPPQNMTQDPLASVEMDIPDFPAGGIIDNGLDDNQAYISWDIPSLNQGTGVNLGFGLAVDSQHDWSEGGGYDLLNDFYFGGANGVA